MNLRSKKALAARTLGVGKDRIILVDARKEEIKEAITKQDIRELHKDGAIIIKPVKGRRKVMKKSKKRGQGNVRKKVNTRKRDYIKLTRKLRAYVAELKKQGKISLSQFKEIRKRIRNKSFRSLSHLKEYLGGLK